MNKHISNIREKAGRHKTLIQNFSYLSALQVFSMILPLITYPYLIRVLGKETYGLVVFAQAIVGYLVILVSFGFNISATKEISVHRNDRNKISEIVSSILLIKTGLFVISSLILIALIYLIPEAQEYKILFFLTMWMCLYDIIFPSWYFQGIERMKYITYITLISRLTFVGLIFVFIQTSDDYLFIPIISGIGGLLAGIISLYIVFIKHRIKFLIPSYEIIKHTFVDSIPIFLSNLSIRLYVSTNKVIVGTFMGMTEVAYYDLGEKVTNIFKMPQGILSQTLFPKISKEKNLNFIKQIFRISTTFNGVLFLLMLIFSKYIVVFLGGKEMLNSTIVLDILALTVPIIAMSNVFGIQLLIPFGHKKSFSKVILTSGLVYAFQASVIWITVGFTIINVSMITVTTEIFVTAFMFYYCKKYRLWI